MKSGIPPKSGYYWLKIYTTNMVTKQRMVSTIEIVIVAHEYQHRGKNVPHVIALHWKCPLSKVHPDDEWSEQILPPE